MNYVHKCTESLQHDAKCKYNQTYTSMTGLGQFTIPVRPKPWHGSFLNNFLVSVTFSILHPFCVNSPVKSPDTEPAPTQGDAPKSLVLMLKSVQLGRGKMAVLPLGNKMYVMI